jgi:hypothetical protein
MTLHRKTKINNVSLQIKFTIYEWKISVRNLKN